MIIINFYCSEDRSSIPIPISRDKWDGCHCVCVCVCSNIEEPARLFFISSVIISLLL